MADHYRAAADVVMMWELSNSKHCNVEVAEWLPNPKPSSGFLGFRTRKAQTMLIQYLMLEVWVVSRRGIGWVIKLFPRSPPFIEVFFLIE